MKAETLVRALELSQEIEDLKIHIERMEKLLVSDQISNGIYIGNIYLRPDILQLDVKETLKSYNEAVRLKIINLEAEFNNL